LNQHDDDDTDDFMGNSFDHIDDEKVDEERTPSLESDPKTLEQACQFPEKIARLEYESLQERRKRSVRNDVMEQFLTVINSCTTSTTGASELLSDILHSKKFRNNFGDVLGKPHEHTDSKILKSLAKDYEACKAKEMTQLINLQQGKFNEKILIGDSLKLSNLRNKGSGPNRTEIAKSIGRLSKFGEERRRLLSIVAWDFTQSELHQYFKCSKQTITAARVHATLFGKGGAPRDGLKFTKQSVKPEVIKEFEEFLHQDDISRPSSCRSVLVDNKETGVRYWQCPIKDVVEQYMLKYPNGVKRTYIYAHLPENFRADSMLAGLCNLCDDFGHTNFEVLQQLVLQLDKENVLENANSAKEVIREHQKYLKLQYKKQVGNFSFCYFFFFFKYFR